MKYQLLLNARPDISSTKMTGPPLSIPVISGDEPKLRVEKVNDLHTRNCP